MRIIDARTGREVPLASGPVTLMTGITQWCGNEPRVDYGDGESIMIHAVRPKMFGLQADALITNTYRDPFDGRLRTSRAWVPLGVRFTHPKFFGHHVAFIPS